MRWFIGYLSLTVALVFLVTLAMVEADSRWIISHGDIRCSVIEAVQNYGVRAGLADSCEWDGDFGFDWDGWPSRQNMDHPDGWKQGKYDPAFGEVAP